MTCLPTRPEASWESGSTSSERSEYTTCRNLIGRRTVSTFNVSQVILKGNIHQQRMTQVENTHTHDAVLPRRVKIYHLSCTRKPELWHFSPGQPSQNHARLFGWDCFDFLSWKSNFRRCSSRNQEVLVLPNFTMIEVTVLLGTLNTQSFRNGLCGLVFVLSVNCGTLCYLTYVQLIDSSQVLQTSQG